MKRLALLLALVACGKSKASCKADVDAFMTFMHSFDHDPSLFMISDDTKLVVRKADKPKDMAPVVVITANEITYRGQLVDAQALADGLVETRTKIADDIERGRVGNTKLDAALLYFQIDGDAPWDKVVAATTAAAGAGFTHASFVFVTGDKPTPPPHTWVDDKLDELRKNEDKASNLATGIADLTSGVVKSCPALVKLYGTVAATNDDKATFLVEGTGPALIDCNCDADIPALRSIMWRLLSNPHPTSVVGVELAKDGGTPIAFAATTPWREAQKSIAAGAHVTVATK